jgi:hypothetical protein
MAPAPRSRAIGLNFRPPVMDGGHVSVCVSCCSPPGAQRRLRRPRARGLRRRAPFRSRRGCFTARNTAGFPNVPGRSRGRRGLLTPSTPFAYPHVVSRRFACFHVVRFSVSAVQRHLYSGFDSRQLRIRCPDQSRAGHRPSRVWGTFIAASSRPVTGLVQQIGPADWLPGCGSGCGVYRCAARVMVSLGDLVESLQDHPPIKVSTEPRPFG